jgi:HPr kinase/phosphorylase
MFTIPGTLLEIFGQGVLIQGESGVGKSILALELIHRGHRLVADDAVCFEKCGDKLLGCCPPQTQNFMYVEEFGMINVQEMFGMLALSQEAELQLVVLLCSSVKTKSERLSGSYETTSILGVDIPTLMMLSNPMTLVILIETAVRNQMLQKKGYFAAEVFSAQQMQFMDSNVIKQS